MAATITIARAARSLPGCARLFATASRLLAELWRRLPAALARLRGLAHAPLALDLLLLAPLLLGPLAPAERYATLLSALLPLALLHEAATRLSGRERALGPPSRAWLVLGLLGLATLVALAPQLALPALLAAVAASLRAAFATTLAGGLCLALGAALRVDAGLSLLAVEHGPIAPLFVAVLVLLGSLEPARAGAVLASASSGPWKDALRLAARVAAAALWPALLTGLGLLGAEPRPWAVASVFLLLAALLRPLAPRARAAAALPGRLVPLRAIPPAGPLWAAWLATVALGAWSASTAGPDFVP
ncbi:MAG: hypothetical protein N3D77_10510 [Geminicoccaceae bacterium]|nr:hypothetical protein [Geminicoccaceae bacterium]